MLIVITANKYYMGYKAGPLLGLFYFINTFEIESNFPSTSSLARFTTNFFISPQGHVEISGSLSTQELGQVRRTKY